MAVPNEITNSQNVHIFGYAPNLDDACTTLQTRLGGVNVPYTKIDLSTNPVGYAGDPAVNNNSRVAWLVGHGISTDANIYSNEDNHYAIAIQTIIDWLAAENYTHIVDTCCEPNTRRLANMRGLSYYCAADGRTVTENQYYPNLDAWWDDNGFHQI
jgi:hypothetical protein